MLKIDPDARECMEKGVNLRDFADTLQVYQGSLYVNDLNLFGRTWQVIVQAEHQYRDQEEDIPKLKVRNSAGTMVPLGSLATIRQINGPLCSRIQHVPGRVCHRRCQAGSGFARRHRPDGEPGQGRDAQLDGL